MKPGVARRAALAMAKRLMLARQPQRGPSVAPPKEHEVASKARSLLGQPKPSTIIEVVGRMQCSVPNVMQMPKQSTLPPADARGTMGDLMSRLQSRKGGV